MIRPVGDAQLRARRAALGLRLVAVGCVAVGVWLMVIGVLYADWLALAVATTSILFGVAELTIIDADTSGRTMSDGQGRKDRAGRVWFANGEMARGPRRRRGAHRRRVKLL